MQSAVNFTCTISGYVWGDIVMCGYVDVFCMSCIKCVCLLMLLM